MSCTEWIKKLKVYKRISKKIALNFARDCKDKLYVSDYEGKHIKYDSLKNKNIRISDINFYNGWKFIEKGDYYCLKGYGDYGSFLKLCLKKEDVISEIVNKIFDELI